MENRLEHMKDKAERIFQLIFEMSIQNLMAEYRKPEMFLSIKYSFQELILLINNQKKDKVSYLGVSYMTGSLINREYELLLAAYNEGFYLDKEPAELFIKIPLFYERYEKDMTEVFQELKREFVRIQEWEKDLIRRRLIQYYYAAMCKLFIDKKQELLQIEDMKLLYEKNPFTFYFCRYQGEGVIL